MNRREISLAPDAPPVHFARNPVPVFPAEGVAQPDNIDEPTDHCMGVFRRWHDYVRVLSEVLVISMGYCPAPIEYAADSLDLFYPDCTAQFRNAVVVAQFRMLIPARRWVAALIAHASGLIGQAGIIRYDDAALARSDLLIRIEREYSGISKCPGFPAVIFGAQRLACVFDYEETVTAG